MAIDTKRATLFLAALSFSAASAAWADSVSPEILLAQSEQAAPDCDPTSPDCAKPAPVVPPATETPAAAEAQSAPPASEPAAAPEPAQVTTPAPEPTPVAEPAAKAAPAQPRAEPATAAPAAAEQPAAKDERPRKPRTAEPEATSPAKAEQKPAAAPQRGSAEKPATPNPQTFTGKQAPASATGARPAHQDKASPDARKPAPAQPAAQNERTPRDRPSKDKARQGRDGRPGERAGQRPDRRPDGRKDRSPDQRTDKRPERKHDGKGTLEFSLPIPGVDGRVVIRQDGKISVKGNDEERFKGERTRRQVVELPHGRTRTIIDRPDGTQIITVRDVDSAIIRRVRRTPDGREIVLIDSEEIYRRPHRERDLRFDPLKIDIPRDRYIVESERARPRDIDEALRAAPVERVERGYTLQEIRRYDRLRSKVRRIDLSVTFEFNSAAIPGDQYRELETIGRAMEQTLRDNPDEVYLIEGHTDAPGSDEYNLRLSDARAESVAIALTDYFGIPPENLVSQGYGEEYLKIPTQDREERNRRVTIRRITPLLQGSR